MTITNPDWFVDVLSKGYPDHEDFIQIAFSPEFTAALTESGAYTDAIIASVLMALTNFNCHVQYCGNHFAAELIGKKRYFERKKREVILNLEVPKSITERAKLDLAYKEEPELQIIEDDITALERSVKLYEGMPDRIQEIIQVIKREVDRRNKSR